MGFEVTHRGDFQRTYRYLDDLNRVDVGYILEIYAQSCVKQLEAATPLDSGETAKSWGYEIKRRRGRISLEFTNSHVENGVPIAIILQYGHGTKNGGYVQGRDYINPVVQPIFDRIVEEIWRELTKL